MKVENGKTKKVLWILLWMLKNDMVPLVYGDVVVDSSKGCDVYSTEGFDEMIKYFAKSYQVRVIHVSSEEHIKRDKRVCLADK